MWIAGPAEYISIPLKSFLGGAKSPTDIFLRLDGDKFVKVLKQDQTFEYQRIRRYEGKSVEQVFIMQSDFPRYLEHCQLIATTVAKGGQLTPLHRFSLLQKTVEAMFAEMLINGINKDNFGTSKEMVLALFSGVDADMDVAQLLSAIQEVGEHFVRHSIATAAIATVLSHHLRWTSQRTLQHVAIAGLFHDVGMTKLPYDLTLKPVHDMSDRERSLYESHPVLGEEILKEVPGMPLEVVYMVRDHHELNNQMGFPQKLTSEKIFPLSRIVLVADAVTKQVIEGPLNPHPKKLDEVIRNLYLTLGNNVKSDIWNGLFRMAKISTPN